MADCNNNGVDDADHIDPTDPDGDGQVSLDCNANGVPDECDVTPCSTCLVDVNGDGAANGVDVHVFLELLLAGAGPDCGDINISGGPLDEMGLEQFVRTLLSAPGPCPS